MSLLSVILPAYNEEDCIASTIDEVRKTLESAQIQHEIIVIDDGSTDRTADIAREKKVRLVQHKTNKGVGAARKRGIMESKGDVVVTTDVDGTYPNHEIPRLYKHLLDNNMDMVIGARIGKNVAFEWPHRAVTKFFIRKLASYMSQAPIPDLNSGLRLFRKETALKYFYLLPDSHSFESTITLAFLCNKEHVDFLKIDYYKRKGGKSTFAPLADTYNYISLVVRTIMYFQPLRIFVPLTLLTMAGGSIKIVYDWIVFRDIGSLDVIIFMSGVLIGLVGLLADLVVVMSRKLNQSAR